jgi:hypothetical protein
VSEALAKDPAARPTAKELLARLSGGDGVVARSVPEAVAAVANAGPESAGAGGAGGAEGESAGDPPARDLQAEEAQAEEAQAEEAQAEDRSGGNRLGRGGSGGGGSGGRVPVGAASVTALRPRRRRALVSAMVTAVAVFAVLVVTTAADHGVPRIPSMTGPSKPPPDRPATMRGRRRAHVMPSQAKRTRPAASTQPDRPTVAPSSGSPPQPVGVPTLVQPSLPDVLNRGKGPKDDNRGGRGGGDGEGPAHDSG